MKTVMKLVLSALLAFALVSPAAAFFEKGNLVLVAYDSSGDNRGAATEIAYDFGALSAIDFTTTSTLGTMDFSAFAGTERYAAVSAFTTYAEFSMVTYLTDTYAVVSTSSADVEPIGIRQAQFVGAADPYFENRAGMTESSYELSTTDAESFKRMMNGQFAGYLPNNSTGQANLESIISNQYADLYLQQAVNGGVAEIIGMLRIHADGTVEAMAAAPEVPVPAAVWMLASGLVGLVGIRRKK